METCPFCRIREGALAAHILHQDDEVLAFLDATDGIFAAWPRDTTSLDREVEVLIERRKAAKAAKDWAEADRVREQLKTMGILLEDRKDGTVGWRRA